MTFLESVSNVLPVILLFLLGMLLNGRQFMRPGSIADLKNLVIKIILPAALDVDDLKIQSSQRGVAIVRLGKSRKSREMPLNAGTISALRHWLKIRPTCDHESALFTNKTGRRLAPRAIQAVVEQVGRVAASKYWHVGTTNAISSKR